MDPLAPDAGVSPGCDSWVKGEVYTTGIPAAVTFVYEVVIDDDISGGSSVEDVGKAMEESMAKMVGRELIKCEPLRRLGGVHHRAAAANAAQLHHSRERHLTVDGMDSMPQDVVTQQTCSYYTGDNPETPPNSGCYVIQGFMTLYLREDSVASSTLTSSSRALKALLTAMNSNDPSPFVEFSGDDEYSVSGVRGVRYIEGTPDEGGVLLIDNRGNMGVATGEGIGNAKESDFQEIEEVDALSPVGITLIAIGVAGIVAVAVTVLRNKRKDNTESGRTYEEFYDDGLDFKHHDGGGVDTTTDLDADSLNGGMLSPRKLRNNDDDDSIFSGLETPDANLENAHGPQFVHAHDELGSVAITTDKGYEMGLQFEPTEQFEEMYEYEPRVHLESPRYDNPSGMKQSPEEGNGRFYYVGNMVEF